MKIQMIHLHHLLSEKKRTLLMRMQQDLIYKQTLLIMICIPMSPLIIEIP